MLIYIPPQSIYMPISYTNIHKHEIENILHTNVYITYTHAYSHYTYTHTHYTHTYTKR